MVREYIGARYVPKFMGAYDATQVYEALCVVDNGMGTSYISKIPTPAGTSLTDTTYWAIYGATGGAIINLQNQINDMNDGTVPGSLQNQINTITSNADKKLLVIGNSYVQRDVTLKLQDMFNNSYRKTSGGSGFVARSGNPTTYESLLDDVIADPTNYPLDEITDIIFVSAMGDTWAITELGASTYEASLATTLSSIYGKVSTYFPKCQRLVLTLAEARNQAYFSDDTWSSLFILHKLFKKYAHLNGFDYIGWTGWNTMFAGASYFEIDKYHPTAAGADVIGQNIVDGYFGHMEYETKTSNTNCGFNLTASGSMGVNIYITPDSETIIPRVGNITSGAQTIAVGDVLLELNDLTIPPVAPLDQSNTYIQSDVTTLGGNNTIDRVTCTFENNADGIGVFKLSNATGGASIGASQVVLKDWQPLTFII